jgi:hypothetical protein
MENIEINTDVRTANSPPNSFPVEDERWILEYAQIA